MNCPNCGHDLAEGAERCPTCNVESNWVDDGEDPAHVADAFVTVLKSSDPMLIPVVRSLLEAEGIACTVGNDVLQDLMGGGRMGTGYSVIAGPMFLQVASGDDAEARALIAHHLASPEGKPE